MPRLCPFINKVIKDHLATDWDNMPSDFSSGRQTLNFLKLFLASWERWGLSFVTQAEGASAIWLQDLLLDGSSPPKGWGKGGGGGDEITLQAMESVVSLKSEKVPRSGVLEVRALRTLFWQTHTLSCPLGPQFPFLACHSRLTSLKLGLELHRTAKQMPIRDPNPAGPRQD